jgi:hypothetical protein
MHALSVLERCFLNNILFHLSTRTHSRDESIGRCSLHHLWMYGWISENVCIYHKSVRQVNYTQHSLRCDIGSFDSREETVKLGTKETFDFQEQNSVNIHIRYFCYIFMD